jgi:endonuclease YncB( thermonuclease family)
MFKTIVAISLCLCLSMLVAAIAPAPSPSDIEGRVISVTDGDSLTVLTVDYRPVQVRLKDIDAPEPTQPWSEKSRQQLLGLVLGKTVRVIVQGTDAWGRVLGEVYLGDININQAMVTQGGAWAYQGDEGVLPTYIVMQADAQTARIGLWSMPIDQTVAPWDFRRRRTALGDAQAPEPVAIPIESAASPATSKGPTASAGAPSQSTAGRKPTTSPRSNTISKAPVSTAKPRTKTSAQKLTRRSSAISTRLISARSSAAPRRSSSTNRSTARTSNRQTSGRCGTKRYCGEMNSCREAVYYLNQCGVYRLDGDGDGVPCESICG